MTVRTHQLDNGLRIVSERMEGLKSAALGIWVTAGGRNEQDGESGIAHFLEHMAFKGTERRSAFEIASTIEDLGGYINAYTSREMTAYYVRVLEPDVPLAFDVLSDIVLHSVFDLREIEVERGVILQEIGQSQDNPEDVVFDWLQEIAYPEQAMGRPILGTSETVKSFARDDFLRFVQAHYGPQNLIVSAAGAVDHDALVAAAETQFGELSRQTPKTSPAARFMGGERRVSKSLEQVQFALALEGPHILDADAFVSQVFATALGGGTSSRLFQEVRERLGLCYSVFSQMGCYSDTGMLSVYAGTSPEDIGKLAHVVIDEIRRACDSFQEAEAARARAQLKAGILMGQESASARAERLARMTAIWGRVLPLEETIERIDAVSLADLKSLGERLIHSPMAMALYGTVDKAPAYDTLQARLVA